MKLTNILNRIIYFILYRNNENDISILALGVCFLLLLISISASFILKLKLVKSILISVIRMTIQLVLIGIFLTFIFRLDKWYINLTWVMIMITAAVFSAIRASELKLTKLIIPAMLSFTFSTLVIIFYVNLFVIKPVNIFDAKYLVVLSGMLLGNTLRGNIIGINTFYSNIKKDQKLFHYTLSMGASHYEAVLPYLRESMRLSLRPTIASMATMGLVALPGMMTGNILGGTKPITAIKYQIMIMIAIFTCVTMSVLLTILSTMKFSFNKYGILKHHIFIKENSSKK